MIKTDTWRHWFVYLQKGNNLVSNISWQVTPQVAFTVSCAVCTYTRDECSKQQHVSENKSNTGKP